MSHLPNLYSGRPLAAVDEPTAKVPEETLLHSADIRRSTNAELRENEERLRLALEAGRMGSWEWHIPTGRVTWSAELEAIHGLAPGTFPGTFEAYQHDIHPEDRDHVLRTVRGTLEGRDHHVEYRIVLPNGDVRWVEGRGRLFRDELGEPARIVGVCSDVTERRLAEEARRLSDERVRAIVETTPECVKLVGRDGTLLQMNAAGLGMVGAPGAEVVVGRSIYDVVAPEDRARFREFNERICAGERGRLEFDIIGLGGARRHMETHAVPLAQPEGCYAQLAITRDVTEGRRAEVALKASEERYRSVLGLMPAAVYTCESPSGVISYYNEHAAALWGRRPAPGDTDERFCGSHRVWRSDGTPLPHDQTPMALAMRENRELRNSEVVIERPDGSRVTVLVNVHPLRDEAGRVTGAINVFHDVTERKLADERLRARVRQQHAVAVLGELALRERDLQKVFEQATAAIADTLDVEYCKVLELMPGGQELLLRAGVGWRQGLVGAARVSTKMDSQAGYTFARDAPVIVRDLPTESRFSGPALLTEHGVVSGMSCVIRGAEGEAWGVLGTHATRAIEFTDDDVSFLTAIVNILGHAIQRERAEAALRESDQRKDEFIAMLSHELRNPLAPLRSGLDLMRTRPGHGDEQVRAMMERQVGHLVRLVDDLLETSRINRGLLELRREKVQLADVLRSAVEAAEPLVREAGHRLEVNLAGATLWLHADGVRLSQCFANLLNNAARYTPPGGSIWVCATREADDTVCVSVRDTGTGFAPRSKDRMFEMFARGEGSSGLGIGLALARKLIDMHGGRLEARSEGEGRGAEFLVHLPLVEAPAGAGVEQTNRADGKSYRVVVADDNRDAAESLAALLRALGNEVSVAYDGIEAVEAARRFRPHVMLLDIGMPRLDGYGAAREIRRQSNGEQVRLVALTGWGQEEDRRRARDAGFDAHLVKPAELERLRRLFAEISEGTSQ